MRLQGPAGRLTACLGEFDPHHTGPLHLEIVDRAPVVGVLDDVAVVRDAGRPAGETA